MCHFEPRSIYVPHCDCLVLSRWPTYIVHVITCPGNHIDVFAGAQGPIVQKVDCVMYGIAIFSTPTERHTD